MPPLVVALRLEESANSLKFLCMKLRCSDYHMIRLVSIIISTIVNCVCVFYSWEDDEEEEDDGGSLSLARVAKVSECIYLVFFGVVES